MTLEVLELNDMLNLETAELYMPGISRNVISRNGKLMFRGRLISVFYLNNFTVCRRLTRAATPDQLEQQTLLIQHRS